MRGIPGAENYPSIAFYNRCAYHCSFEASSNARFLSFDGERHSNLWSCSHITAAVQETPRLGDSRSRAFGKRVEHSRPLQFIRNVHTGRRLWRFEGGELPHWQVLGNKERLYVTMATPMAVLVEMGQRRSCKRFKCTITAAHAR